MERIFTFLENIHAFLRGHEKQNPTCTKVGAPDPKDPIQGGQERPQPVLLECWPSLWLKKRSAWACYGGEGSWRGESGSGGRGQGYWSWNVAGRVCRVSRVSLGKRPNPLGFLGVAVQFSGTRRGSLEDATGIRHSMETLGQGSIGAVHPFKTGRCPELPGKTS